MIFTLTIENDPSSKMTTIDIEDLNLISCAPTLTDAENDLRDIIKKQMDIDSVDFDFNNGHLKLNELNSKATVYILRQFKNQHKGLTFDKMAKDLGYENSSGVSPYFQFREQRMPSIAMFSKLCNYLGHSIRVS